MKILITIALLFSFNAYADSTDYSINKPFTCGYFGQKEAKTLKETGFFNGALIHSPYYLGAVGAKKTYLSKILDSRKDVTKDITGAIFKHTCLKGDLNDWSIEASTEDTEAFYSLTGSEFDELARRYHEDPNYEGSLKDYISENTSDIEK